MLDVSRDSRDGDHLVPDPPIYNVSIRSYEIARERFYISFDYHLQNEKIPKQELIASLDGTYYLRYPIYAVK